MYNLKFYERLIITGIVFVISGLGSIIMNTDIWIAATIGCFVYEMIDHIVYYYKIK